MLICITNWLFAVEHVNAKFLLFFAHTEIDVIISIAESSGHKLNVFLLICTGRQVCVCVFFFSAGLQFNIYVCQNEMVCDLSAFDRNEKEKKKEKIHAVPEQQQEFNQCEKHRIIYADALCFNHGHPKSVFAHTHDYHFQSANMQMVFFNAHFVVFISNGLAVISSIFDFFTSIFDFTFFSCFLPFLWLFFRIFFQFLRFFFLHFFIFASFFLLIFSDFFIFLNLFQFFESFKFLRFL